MNEYLVFKSKEDFETVRASLNIANGLPKNGFVEGVERTDGQGRTLEYVSLKKHPKKDEYYFKKDENIPEEVIVKAKEIKDKDAMTVDGWFDVSEDIFSSSI